MKSEIIDTVCIVGDGIMGSQIGLQCASNGYTVWCVDSQADVLQQAEALHVQELDGRLDKNQITSQEKKATLNRIGFATTIEQGARDAQLAIEAVPERLELKREHLCFA